MHKSASLCVCVQCTHSQINPTILDNMHPGRVKFGSPFLLPSRKMKGWWGGGQKLTIRLFEHSPSTCLSVYTDKYVYVCVCVRVCGCMYTYSCHVSVLVI